MHREGKSLREIRRFIDEHYGSRGTPTPTPKPPKSSEE
ncbi:MAG: hypothetical protein CW342_06545 [Thermoactinomycetaceae bacterium]|nr:hypothetical protein [Bacillota bacterium]MBO2532542.1 hypothetical protein [Thermoactinomycetaceae bacterium]